jgi:hypothetical protein
MTFGQVPKEAHGTLVAQIALSPLRVPFGQRQQLAHLLRTLWHVKTRVTCRASIPAIPRDEQIYNLKRELLPKAVTIALPLKCMTSGKIGNRRMDPRRFRIEPLHLFIFPPVSAPLPEGHSYA